MRTTVQIVRRIKSRLTEEGLPSNAKAVAEVWQYYQEPMYGSDAWGDIDASIEDALECAEFIASA